MSYPITCPHLKSTWSCTNSTSVTPSWPGSKTTSRGDNIKDFFIIIVFIYLFIFKALSSEWAKICSFCLRRLKQVMNELLCQQQQSSPAPTGWQTQKQSSFQESGCGPSGSPGVVPVFSSLLNPSANNMAASPIPSFSHSMTFISDSSEHLKDY